MDDHITLTKALLWAGIEGECPLWQAAWELAPLLPPSDERALLDRTQRLVRALWTDRLIRLCWLRPAGTDSEWIEEPEAPHYLDAPGSWLVRGWEEPMVAFITTEAGERAYRALFDG